MERTTKMVGAAGQHYVMYELLRRGFIAALTPEGVPNVDILVSDIVGGHMASIQVKTASAPRPTWPVGTKQEKVESDRLFYCFVMPTDKHMSSPQCWVIPSAVVAEHVRISHLAWLSGTPKRGLSRNDSDRRAMHKSCAPLAEYSPGWLDKYEGAWDQLR